ncbi:Bcr/CflA family efflux MFS transporter [Herbiconiux moechotypicola]|uniref:Bcr/CflA family efflux MFS transporter n=1 Tax=Herbiconiux moechotypicola TaxID=637393 RepID=UPI00217D10AC|nr:Bcr/CflA family efflux MFS transporter [Herbiconiux moechotypicola]MCS5729351.1 Bcr/CflA family efflux MFS transporter [Herbiconiux moechotypicola]
MGATSSARLARILVVLALLTAAAPLSVDIYTPSLPLLRSELGGSESLTQASVTACLLGVAVGQSIWGPLSDRSGRRSVVLVGVAGWTLTSVLSAFAVDAVMLLVVRGLAGLCGAAGIVVARSIVRDLSPDAPSLASRIGVLSLVTAVAPVVAPVTGAVIALAWGWRADFVVLAAFGAVVTLAFASMVPETLPPARRSPATSLLGGLSVAARDRRLRWIAVGLAAHSFGFYAYVASAAFVVEGEFGQPPWVFAVVFATNAVAMLAANLVFRRLVRTRHPSWPLGAGLALAAVSGAAMAVAAVSQAPQPVLWGTSLAFAAATGFVLPGAHSWGQLAPVPSGAASALVGSAQFFGGALGSPVTGLLGAGAANLGVVIAISSSLALFAWLAARPESL